MASQSTTPNHPGSFKAHRKSLALDATVGPDDQQQRLLLVVCELLPTRSGGEGPLLAQQRQQRGRRPITICVAPSTRIGELAACIQQRLNPAPVRDKRCDEQSRPAASLRFLGGNGNTGDGGWGVADVLSPMATIGQVDDGRARRQDGAVHIFYFEEGMLGGRGWWPQELVLEGLGTRPPIVDWPGRPLAPRFLPRKVVEEVRVVGEEKEENSTKEEGVGEKSRSEETDAAAGG